MVALALACSPAPAELGGTWLAADLHVHSSVGSNDTDGLGTVDALGPAMARAGLDVVFLTDHSNAQGSMDCADVEDCPNRGPEITPGDWPAGVYGASEISPIASLDGFTDEPAGHVGCIPRDAVAFTAEVPPGSVGGGDAVEQCVAAGGFATVNHPYAAAPWITYDWASESFDAIEVYNGGSRFDAYDALGVEAWEARVADGRPIVPVGGSDCHRWGVEPPGDTLNPPLGWPTTFVRVLDGESPIDAIVAGRVIVAEPTTTLSFEVRRGRDVAGPGDAIDGPADAIVTATSTEPGLVLELRAIGGEVVDSAPLAGSTTLAATLDPGVYYARVWPIGPVPGLGTGGVATTNAVVVRASRR